MKIPNPKSIRSQSSATSNKTLEIQCLIGNPKILTHPSRLLQFSCFKKRFKPGGFSLTRSLSPLLRISYDAIEFKSGNQKKSNKNLVRTQFEPRRRSGPCKTGDDKCISSGIAKIWSYPQLFPPNCNFAILNLFWIQPNVFNLTECTQFNWIYSIRLNRISALWFFGLE